MGIFDQMNYLQQRASVCGASSDTWYDVRTDRLITSAEEQRRIKHQLEMMLQQQNAAAHPSTPKPAEPEWRNNELLLLTP